MTRHPWYEPVLLLLRIRMEFRAIPWRGNQLVCAGEDELVVIPVGRWIAIQKGAFQFHTKIANRHPWYAPVLLLLLLWLEFQVFP